MNGLLVAPDIQMARADEAAWEMQRLGLNVFPLTGRVTEAQLAEQCTPERGYDFVVFLTHGTGNGVYLSGGPDAEGPSSLLPLESVAAYMQAAGTVSLIVFAVCHGHGVAKEVFYRTGATVVYNEGTMQVDTAFTLLATFFRRLKSAGLEEAVKVADTLGLHFYPRTSKTTQDVSAQIQSLSAQLIGRLGILEQHVSDHYERTEQRFDGLEGRIAAVEKHVQDVADPKRGVYPFVRSPLSKVQAFRIVLAAQLITLALLLLYDAWGRTFSADIPTTLLMLVLALAGSALLFFAGFETDWGS